MFAETNPFMTMNPFALPKFVFATVAAALFKYIIIVSLLRAATTTGALVYNG